MEALILKAVGFICIIILGYVLKKIEFFKLEDGLLLSKIVINITLPAALISGNVHLNISFMSLGIILSGFISNLISIYLSKFINRKSNVSDRAIGIINSSGYNVVNFIAPFAMSFFEPIALAYVYMFDIGNTFMALGGSYAIAKSELDEDIGIKVKIKKLINSLKKSIAFNIYMFLFIISTFKLSIPSQVLSITSMIGSANSFVVMIMIGISIEVNISKEQIKSVLKILGVRYLGSIISMVIIYVLPFPLLAKQIMIMILFSPLTTLSTIYSKEIDKENPTPALANLFSIVIGLCMLTLISSFII